MTLRLNGSTSGYVEIDAPAVAGTSALTLPTGTGTLLTAEGGKVLQVVRATDSTARTTTSTTYVDVTGMSITITPQRSNSKVIIFMSAFIQSSFNGSNPWSAYRLVDSSNNPLSGAEAITYGLLNSTQSATPQVFAIPATIIAYTTPSTTSAVTYKAQFKADFSGATTTFSNNTSTGQLYAIEVSA